MKKGLKILSVILIFVFLISVPAYKAVADSGFDSSYDSGGSWDSGSSWDYDSGGSYSGSSSGGSFMISFIIFVIVGIIIISEAQKKNHLTEGNAKAFTPDVPLPKFDLDSIARLKELGIYDEPHELVQKFFNKYVEIQNAWMNFDYDKLRTLVTDELYNQYESQLRTLSIKGEKNVMSDYRLISGFLTCVNDVQDEITVKTQMTVEMYDYIVNQNNVVLRGNQNRKITITYTMFFKIHKSTDGFKFCPNCGAELKEGNSAVCDYCNANIVKPTGDWVLSKKLNIGQR